MRQACASTSSSPVAAPGAFEGAAGLTGPSERRASSIPTDLACVPIHLRRLLATITRRLKGVGI